MTSRLFPWPRRALLHLRASGGGLAVVVVTALLVLALEAGSGGISGEIPLFVVLAGVPLVLSARGVGVRSGTATLWVQKPVEPVRYYLARVAENAAVAAGATAALSVIVALVARWNGMDPLAHPVWTLCVALSVPFLVASMTGGATMWLPRTGRPLIVAAFLGTIALQFSLGLDPELGNRLWVRLAGWALPPWESLRSLYDLDALQASEAASAILRIILYAGVWIGAGALGLRRSLANGTLSRPSSS